MQYKEGNNKLTEWVYYEGTDTLGEGWNLCYNADYGTAASVDGERLYRVEKPSTTNNFNYAGFVHPDSAGKTGPCKVRIFKPGSAGNIYAKVNATVNVTRMTACAGQYYMYTAGMPGAGSARCLQTIDRSSTPGLIQAIADDGPQSGLVELISGTTFAAGGATTCMVGGVTYFAVTTLAQNATVTLADGTWLGMSKGFVCEGTMTTSDVVLTITTPALIAAVATAGYDVVTMDAAGEGWWGIWTPTGWFGSGKTAA